MGDLQLGIKITADGQTADMEFNRIRQSLTEVGKSAKSIESNLGSMANVAKNAFAAMAASFSVKQLIETTDAYTNMSSKLKLATTSAQEFAIAQKSLFSIAQDNKTALNETVGLYTRIAVGMREMGASQSQVLKVVDNVGKALKISGASTSEAASVTTQLSQALASGVLRGEEFNSVMENGPRIARAIADGLDVPIGKLRQMAQEGQLSSSAVIAALESQSAALDREAQTMQTTVGQAWQMIENAATAYVGEADQASGKSRELANELVNIAENFNQIADTVAPLFVTIVQGWTNVIAAIQQVKIALGDLDAYAQTYGVNQAISKEEWKARKQGNQPQANQAELEKKAQQIVASTAKVSKASKQAASDAEAAFKATIDANVKAAEDAAKLYGAQAKTSAMRFDNERKQAEEAARIAMKATESQQEKLQIAEELRKKQETLIAQETRLREEQLSKDEAALMARINGINLEIETAGKYNLKQSERIKLQTELQSLTSQQQAIPEERAQIQLESMAKLAEASKQYNDIRLDGETNVREEALRTLEVLSSNLEYAKEMASGLADAFGDVGSAIGGMTVALAEYAKQQETINIQAAEDIKKDPSRKLEIEQEAMLKSSRTQIKAYGDMTQAAQGFFKKGTKGYEALGGAVKVFRAFEMAQSVMSAVKQMEQMGGLLGFFTASLEQMGIISSVNTTKEIAQSTAKAQAKAVEGAANQGTQGDPYSAFARVAAWVALMAGLGIAISGGGGGGSAPAVKPPEPGTGTVKGDPMAVSESISKSIGIIEENSSNDLNYSADMLNALYQIRDALGGVENLIASDLTPAISDLMLKFGDGVKQAGFLFRDQQLSKILSTKNVQGYIGARVETESSQMMVTVKKGQTMVAEYGKQFGNAFYQVVESIRKSVVEVGSVIGITETQIMDRLKGFKVKLGTIDIAGLSAEEAAKKIEAAFSAMSDTMAMKALPEFKDFQQSGEGYKETIVRVAEGIQRATGNLELLGMEAINYTEITNKNKDVAAEITRQTIMAQGDLSEGTRKYVKQLTGSAEDIVDSYKQILNITKLLRGSGFNTENLDRTMINAAGGLSAFEEVMQSFYDNYLTDGQKVSSETANLEKAFARLGMSMPKNRAEFYQMAFAINTSTEEGKKLFAQFVSLNQQFSELQDASEELAQTQADEAQKAADAVTRAMDEIRKRIDSAMSYQIQIYRLLGNEEEALRLEREKAMEGMDDATRSYARAIYQLQDANAALVASQKGLETAYKSLLSMRDRFVTLGQGLRKYYDELTGVSGPNASPQSQYLAAAVAFRETSKLAAQGVQQAVADLPDVSKAFLEASKQYNATGTQYQSDFNEVLTSLKTSMSAVDTQIDIMNRQLAVARMSYDKLGDLDGTTGTVESAVNNMNKAIANYTNAQATYSSATAVANGILEAIKQVIQKGNSDINNLKPVAPAPAPAPVPTPVPKPTTPGSWRTPVREIPGGAAGSNPFASEFAYKYSPLDAANMVTFYYRQLLGREPENQNVIDTRVRQLTAGVLASNTLVREFRASPEYQELIRAGFIPGFAKGGMASPGLAIVGEEGPELVRFGSPAHVSTASQTQDLFSGIQASIEKGDKDQTTELQALVRLQSAANRQLIKEMREMKAEMAELTRKAKLEAAA